MKSLHTLAFAIVAAVYLIACGPTQEQIDASAAVAEAAASAEDAAATATEAANAAQATLESNGNETQPESVATSNESIALLINLNSLLCAEVVEINPLKMRPSVFEVTCVEYRGGKATKTYIVDTDSGTAFEQ
jgi:hypothetical protein